MTATVVGITPDDLETELCPVTVALGNLAQIHQLPPSVALNRVTRPDGRTVLVITLEQAHAEQWRAALGAPPYTSRMHQFTTQYTTERLWFGATVRLSYSTTE